MKKGKKFVVILNTIGDTIIDHTDKSKDVDEWHETYANNEHAIELRIYQRKGLAYECVYHDYKRRIGF